MVCMQEIGDTHHQYNNSEYEQQAIIDILSKCRQAKFEANPNHSRRSR